MATGLFDLPCELIHMIADKSVQLECKVPAFFHTCHLGRLLGDSWCQERLSADEALLATHNVLSNIELFEKVCHVVRKKNIAALEGISLPTLQALPIWHSVLHKSFKPQYCVQSCKKRKIGVSQRNIDLNKGLSFKEICAVAEDAIDNEYVPIFPETLFGQFVEECWAKYFYYRRGGVLQYVDSYMHLMRQDFQQGFNRRGGLIDLGLPCLTTGPDTVYVSYDDLEKAYYRLEKRCESVALHKLAKRSISYDAQVKYGNNIYEHQDIIGHIHMKALMANAIVNKERMQWDSRVNPSRFFPIFKRYCNYHVWCYGINEHGFIFERNRNSDLRLVHNSDLVYVTDSVDIHPHNQHVHIPLNNSQYEQLAALGVRNQDDFDSMQMYQNILLYFVSSLKEYMTPLGLSRYVRNVCRYRLTHAARFFILALHNTYWSQLRCQFTNADWGSSRLKNSGQECETGSGYYDVLSRKEVLRFERNLKELELFDIYFHHPEWVDGVLQ